MGTRDKHDFKTVILGKTNVGKTSIVERLIYDRFSRRIVSTVGAAFTVWTNDDRDNDRDRVHEYAP